MTDTIMRVGNLALKDLDGDPTTDASTHLYCITYVDPQDKEEADFMLLWRNGKKIKARSVSGVRSGYAKNTEDIYACAKLIGEANRLLGGE